MSLPVCFCCGNHPPTVTSLEANLLRLSAATEETLAMVWDISIAPGVSSSLAAIAAALAFEVPGIVGWNSSMSE